MHTHTHSHATAHTYTHTHSSWLVVAKQCVLVEAGANRDGNVSHGSLRVDAAITTVMAGRRADDVWGPEIHWWLESLASI